MRLARVLSRLALLLVAAAAFAGLTEIYGDSMQPPPPGPRFRAIYSSRPPAPQLNRFPNFVGAVMGLALIAVVGRIGLRLRLTPAPRKDGEPILLGLGR